MWSEIGFFILFVYFLKELLFCWIFSVQVILDILNINSLFLYSGTCLWFLEQVFNLLVYYFVYTNSLTLLLFPVSPLLCVWYPCIYAWQGFFYYYSFFLFSINFKLLQFVFNLLNHWVEFLHEMTYKAASTILWMSIHLWHQ